MQVFRFGYHQNIYTEKFENLYIFLNQTIISPPTNNNPLYENKQEI